MQCLHSILVLASDSDYRDIYTLMARFLDDGFAVIYGVGTDAADAPKGEFVNYVYSRISQSGIIRDLEHRRDIGALRIMDIKEIYSGSRGVFPGDLLKRWTSIVTDVRKSRDFRGILVIAGGIRVFTDTDSQNKLAAYEQSILRALTELGSIQVICCYMPESLQRLEFSNLMMIASAHQCAMDEGAGYREISGYSLLEAINSGVERTLGPGSSKLILQTMKMIYKLDENAILSRPDVFEEKLRKLLGNASPSVLDSICDRVRQLL